MADDNMKNNNFGAGFMADMLKDLQKELNIDKKPIYVYNIRINL